jgi:hypothetical protein
VYTDGRIRRKRKPKVEEVCGNEAFAESREIPVTIPVKNEGRSPVMSSKSATAGRQKADRLTTRGTHCGPRLPDGTIVVALMNH